MDESESLSSLFNKPENLLKLVSAIKETNFDDLLKSPNESDKKDVNEDTSQTDVLSSLPQIASFFGGMSDKKDNKNICLLKALKPFLSSKRGEMIDKICSFSKISGLFGNLGGK